MTIGITLDAGGIPAPTVAGSPVLFLDPRDGEWTVMLADGTTLSDLYALDGSYGPLVAVLGELAHTLNAEDSSPEACQAAQALLGDDARARSQSLDVAAARAARAARHLQSVR